MHLRKCCLVAYFLSCISLAQPRIFLDTFGPNNATRPDGVGFGRVPGGAIHTASTYFRVDRDTALTRIDMGVQLREGANEIEVVLSAEHATIDQPGDPIESFRLSGVMERRTTGYGVLRIDSTLRPLLRPGRRYWITAKGVGAAPDTFAGWGLNNVGDINPPPVPRGMAATNPRPAMRLWGEFAGSRLLLQAVHSGRLGAGVSADTWITLFGEGLSETTRLVSG